MYKYLCIFLFCFSWINAFASEGENVSGNNLVDTYYLNAELSLKTSSKDCIFWANKAIAESTIQDNCDVLCKSYFIKGKAHEQLKLYNDAIYDYVQSRNVAMINNLSDLEFAVLKQIAKLYAHIGNFKMAVKYSELLRVRKDSSEVIQLKAVAKDLPGKVELDKEEVKIKQLIADKSQLDSHLRSNLRTIDNQGKWILFIVLGYSLVFISFIWMSLKRVQFISKNRLNKKMAFGKSKAIFCFLAK